MDRDNPDTFNRHTAMASIRARSRIIFCTIAFMLSVGLGISIGYTQRTPEFNLAATGNPISASRIVTLQTDLVAVDATAGTMTIDWSFLNDTACDSTKTPPCPGLDPNSTVDVFFDMNILSQGTSAAGVIPSDNSPIIPIFRHNATAVYARSVRNALSAFRTQLALFSNIRGRSSLSTLQRYPFDEYTAQIFIFASDSQTGASIGLDVGAAHGIAVGFKAIASPTPFRGYPGVISELITITRSPLLKAYVLIIVIAVWFLTLMFMFVTVCILCGYGFDVSLLLVPVATLFAITQLRASMPGAPSGFGAIIDFVGILPCLALTSISASLTIGALVFSTPTKHREPIWHKILEKRTKRNKRQSDPEDLGEGRRKVLRELTM